MGRIAEEIEFPLKAIRERNRITHSNHEPRLKQIVSCYIDLYQWLFHKQWAPLLKKAMKNEDIYNTLKFDVCQGNIKELPLLMDNYEESQPSQGEIDRWVKGNIAKWTCTGNLKPLLKSLIISLIKSMSVEILNDESLESMLSTWQGDHSNLPTSLELLIKVTIHNKTVLTVAISILCQVFSKSSVISGLLAEAVDSLSKVIFETHPCFSLNPKNQEED